MACDNSNPAKFRIAIGSWDRIIQVWILDSTETPDRAMQTLGWGNQDHRKSLQPPRSRSVDMKELKETLRHMVKMVVDFGWQDDVDETEVDNIVFL